ncbi:9125_t:CDS:2 [Acaulospora colombiana]|uniref:9125_t:CDS:1 n=1 Tax=Acaulospora colombiana TaxID=27376 RepID=A0ACA9KCM8_9GLOM|nr:9125_t:CDS:2 [Acaulospora colombiana]
MALEFEKKAFKSSMDDKIPSFFPLDTSDISITENSLNQVIAYFEKSKYNRDLCSEGAEIARKSKQVFNKIEELTERYFSYQQQDEAHSDLMSPENSTGINRSKTFENKKEKNNALSDVKSPLKSPLSAGAFQGFLEDNKELLKFTDILWKISIFFNDYEAQNVESFELRNEIKKLTEELNKATTNLQNAIEKWRLKRSGWNSNIKAKIFALAKIRTIMKHSSCNNELEEFEVKNFKISEEKLKPAHSGVVSPQKHAFSELNATEENPIFRGSKNHIRQYWYLGFRRVAEKDLGKFGMQDKMLMKLKKEIDFMKKLKEQGPNIHILEFLGYCQRSNKNFSVICEWGDYNLQTYLAEHVDLVWDEKLNIASGIADALKYCHGKNVLHYDVRTENVLLDQHLQPKLYNFRFENSSVMLTSPDAAIDDPRYSSPERLRGVVYSKASEIYSFAMVMWEIQHNQKPYADLNPDQIKTKILAGEYPELEPVTGTPEEFQNIMEKAWSLSPDKRPGMQLLHELLEKLDFAFLSSQRVKLIGIEENNEDRTSKDSTQLDTISNNSILENKGFGKNYNPLVEKSPEIENGIHYHDERKYKKAWKVFREYEDYSHDPEAMYWVGYYYLKGLYDGKNGKPDPEKGIPYLSSAARLDHAESQFLYAITILNTPQVAKEHKKDRYKHAVNYLKRAAQHNHPRALKTLGGIIMNGKYNQERDVSLGRAMIKQSSDILKMIREKRQKEQQI